MHRQRGEHSRVDVCTKAEQASAEVPVAVAAAGDVARSDHDITTSHQLDHPWQELGRMREISIELNHVVVEVSARIFCMACGQPEP